MKTAAEKIAVKYVPELHEVYEMVKKGKENVEKVDKIVTSVETELQSPERLANLNQAELHLTANTRFSATATPQDGAGAEVAASGNSNITLNFSPAQARNNKELATIELLEAQLEALADSPLADVQTKAVLKEGITALNAMKPIVEYSQELESLKP
jgi:hypothetical protein